MDSKRAQSEIITTVLIILLVLAAIVIVWQVVQSTIKSGGEKITEQNKCIGVDMIVQNTSNVTAGAVTTWSAVRTSTGGTFTAASVIVVQNGARAAPSGEYANGAFNTPLGSATFTLPALDPAAATTSLEVAYIGDGITCPTTAKWP